MQPSRNAKHIEAYCGRFTYGTPTTDTRDENEDNEDEDKETDEADEGTGIVMLATELDGNERGAVLDDKDVGTGNPGVEELEVKAEDAGADEDVGNGVLIGNVAEEDDEVAGAVDDGKGVTLDSELLA